jgi:NTE family protein
MQAGHTPEIAISLTGGGARGSYQAGVLLGLSEILKENGLLGRHNPIKYWCGVSAGSINAVYCAGGAESLDASASRLAVIWDELKPERIYRTDVGAMSKNGIKWLKDLTLGPLVKSHSARSLFDTSPLFELIDKGVLFDRVGKNIAEGYIKALACSAYSYRDARTITFLQTDLDAGWEKPKRASSKTVIDSRHVMASCAIPILFPSISIDGEYFADGSFRDTAPVSPMVHLGAKKILVVGVQGPNELLGRIDIGDPGVARIAGTILNALFFDTLAIDLERMNHMNEIVRALKKDVTTERSDYSLIDLKIIQPSRDISAIAYEKIRALPKTVEYLMAGLGSREDTATLASYILFDSSFTNQLIELGYKDLKAQRQSIVDWITAPPNK